MTAGLALLVALVAQSPIDAAGIGLDGAVARARLDVRAAPECTSRGDLAARIAARSPRIQLADDAPLSAQVTVTSARAGNVVAEVVFLQGAAGTGQPPRRIVARSCAEAADAIAVIVAVALDPRPDTSARTSSATEAGAAPASRPAATPPKPPAPAERPAAPATVESAAPPARPSSVAAGRRYGAYLAGQTIFGPAPTVMPGVALYAMAELERDGPWAPAVFVGATRVWRADLSEPGGTASFTLDAVSVDACPLRLAWRLLTARPCASALVGWLTASGADTDQAASATRPFTAAGLAVNAGFGTTVELSVRLGVGVTLIRDSYEFALTTFHRAGAITTSASLGLGLRWP